MKKYLIALAVLLCSAPAIAHDHNAMMAAEQPTAPDMASHHSAYQSGKWSFTYDYSFMKMDGLRRGTNKISATEAISGGGYMMVPTKMDMRMHMGSVMYQATPRLELMAMIPYSEKDMDMISDMGVKSKMSSSGLGDLQLSGHYRLMQGAKDYLGMTLGLSLPSGSTDETDTDGSHLPYDMQLGSGTYDPVFGLAYSHKQGKLTLAISGNAIIRMGENDQGYRFGNEYGVSLSARRSINPWLAGVLRLDGKRNDDIHGRDGTLMTSMSPANDPNLQAGEKLDAVIGLNLVKPEGVFANSQIGVEFGAPLYQRLDGPQLEEDYHIKAGLRMAF